MRREYREVPPQERSAFVRAIKKLNNEGIWGTLAKLHEDGFDTIHSHGNFYPWHSGFLFLLETLIMDREPSVKGLPYFEWGAEVDTRKSSIWHSAFLGGQGTNGIPNGPFKDFQVRGKKITRSFSDWLSTKTDNLLVIEAVIANEDKKSFWLGEGKPDVSDELELLHNRLHLVVGGTMLEGDSPRDPVFYLHHAFVDKWWAKMWPKAGGFSHTSGPKMLQNLPLDRGFSNLGGFTLQNSLDIQSCVQYIDTKKDAPVVNFVDSAGVPLGEEKDISNTELSAIAKLQRRPLAEVQAVSVLIAENVDQAVAAREIPILNKAVAADVVPDAAPMVAREIGAATPPPVPA